MSDERRRLPAVLGVELGDGVGDCHCLCAARHPEIRGVCTGRISIVGFRVHLNSVYSVGAGVPICGPCGLAWPEDLPSLLPSS